VIPVSIFYGWGDGDTLCRCQEKCQGESNPNARSKLRILNHGDLIRERELFNYPDSIEMLPRHIFSKLNKSHMKDLVKAIQAVPTFSPFDSALIPVYFGNEPVNTEHLNDDQEQIDANFLASFYSNDVLLPEGRLSSLHQNTSPLPPTQESIPSRFNFTGGLQGISFDNSAEISFLNHQTNVQLMTMSTLVLPDENGMTNDGENSQVSFQMICFNLLQFEYTSL
jgi:hypothetical protein